MSKFYCLFCGRIISSNDPVVSVYLNPKDNSWNIEKSTPFQLTISPCCSNESCVSKAWEEAKLSTIGEIEKTGIVKNKDPIPPVLELLENEWDKKELLRKKFDESNIGKRMSKLMDERYHLSGLDRFKKSLGIMREIVDLMPVHIKHWVEIFGDIEDYYDPSEEVLYQLVRGYVVLMDKNAIMHVLSVIEEANTIANDELYDFEVLEHDFQSFIEDIKTFEKIRSYIQENPGVLQNKLYKILSLEGRKTVYMLDYAHQMEVILRTRHRDTWMLQIYKN